MRAGETTKVAKSVAEATSIAKSERRKVRAGRAVRKRAVRKEESESAKLQTELEASELEEETDTVAPEVALEVALSAASRSLILCQDKARNARRLTRDANPLNFAGNIFLTFLITAAAKG